MRYGISFVCIAVGAAMFGMFLPNLRGWDAWAGGTCFVSGFLVGVGFILPWR